MKTISFKDLYLTDYTLDKIFAMRQKWAEHAVFNTLDSPRPTNCLLFLCGCRAVYTRRDRTVVTAKSGSIVYVPQGARYQVEFVETAKNSPQAILLEFELKTPQNTVLTAAPDITVLEETPGPAMTDLFEEMANAYTRPVISHAVLKSISYRILSELSRRFYQDNIFSREFKSISEGILYMEKNFDQALSIEEIAGMCHVSVSCFRRLFHKYSGMSPVQYKTAIKLDYAKKLLQNNAMKISEIAAMLGYDDPSYFCRVFKKHTGYSPAKYAGN